MIKKSEKLNKCRSCKESSLDKFLTLPNMPFTDEFVSSKNTGTEFLSDIDIYVCNSCQTVQTQNDVFVDDYYEDYQYSVGASETAMRFMNSVVENTKNKFLSKTEGKFVLEIGSGDGEQLLAFKNMGFNILGYEPSSQLCKIAKEKGVESIQGLFTKDSLNILPDSYKSADVIMLSYTFDHLPQPFDFLETASEIIDDDGILIIEIHNLELIIDRNEYCLFEHEHSIYLTEETASDICERAGFKIIDFNLVPVEHRRGNSLIFVAAKKDSKKFLNKLDIPSTSKKFKDKDFLSDSANRIYKSIDQLDAFIDKQINNGKKVAGYGAGGRGVMTLAASKNSHYLEYIVDKNPKFEGCKLPKSYLPVEHIEKLAEQRVDTIIVFSFGYMNEISSFLKSIGYQGNQIISILDIIDN